MDFYGTAVAFREYHELRGRTIPAGWTATFINAALLVASEWIDNIYECDFSGFKTDGFTQRRSWPRQTAYANTWPVYVFEDTEIPWVVEEATYEVAWRHANNPESLNVDYTAPQYKAVSVDGAVSVEYNTTLDVQDVQVQIEQIYDILKPVFSRFAGSSSLSGDVGRT